MAETRGNRRPKSKSAVSALKATRRVENVKEAAAKDFVRRMSRAFSGLTEEELLLVNGIHVTERKRRRRV